MRIVYIAILAGLSTVASGADQQFDKILGECWEGHGHPEMSACVESRAIEAQSRLKETEAQLRKGIAQSEESAGYSRHAAIAALEASSKSFREYRRKQCDLVYAVASMGQGAEDNKRACEAQLNLERVAQLKAIYWWVQPASLRNPGHANEK